MFAREAQNNLRLEFLRRIGFRAMVMIPSQYRHKLEGRTVEAYLVGYSSNQSGYRLWIPSADAIMVSRDAKFGEHLEYPATEKSQTDANQIIDQLISSDFQNLDEEQEIKSAREMHVNSTTPNSWNEVLHHPEKQLWINAAEEEITELNKCNTWSIVEKPQSKRVIGSKWVFKMKTNAKGEAVRRKARFVARGFTQQFGTDFTDIYSPTISKTSLRIFLAITVKLHLILRQIDVKCAFVQGEIDHEVYVEQPPGFGSKDTPRASHVLKLIKALYGLKQSPLL
jgi:Reverse transcriptase (RNA-dependent DNA polymerase)